MKSEIDGEKLLRLRDDIYKRICHIRRERDFLNDHGHQIETMVKHKIKEELETANWAIERLLDEAGIKYTYATT